MPFGSDMRTFLITFVIALVFAAPTIWATEQPRANLQEDVVRNDRNYKIVLGFDLRRDVHPQAGLLIHRQATSNTDEQHLILLPIPTTGSTAGTARLPTALGALDECCTIVSYIQSRNSVGDFMVPLAPSFSPPPADANLLPGRLYLLRFGQDHRFIYKYPDPDTPALNGLANLPFAEQPEAIAVALPKAEAGNELQGGPISNVKAMYETKVSRFYAASRDAAGANFLEVRFSVPLSSNQKTLLKLLAEFFGAILVPLLALAFVDSKELRKRKWRHVVLAGGILLEIVALGWMGWLAYSSWGEDSLDSIGAVSIAIIAGLFSAVVLYVKRNGEEPAL